MRKIEAQMIDAFLSCRDWHNSNTEVRFFNGLGSIFLHGHLILEQTENSINISLCGWNTVTTRSRLNAILSVITEGRVAFNEKRIWERFRVCQRNFLPCLLVNDEVQEISSTDTIELQLEYGVEHQAA